VSALAELLPKTVDGVIFSAPLVPPVLDGRKTVTRRLSKNWLKRKVGDLLFVRENWKLVSWGFDVVFEYAADGARAYLPVPEDRSWYHRETDRVHAFRTKDENRGAPLRPSIFLPRWASRCVLSITEPPRRERVLDITEDDAKREGVEPIDCSDLNFDCDKPHKHGFVETWKSLHKKPGERWKDNPQVVRIAFERVA
jgi:hypothetical protein